MLPVDLVFTHSSTLRLQRGAQRRTTFTGWCGFEGWCLAAVRCINTGYPVLNHANMFPWRHRRKGLLHDWYLDLITAL